MIYKNWNTDCSSPFFKKCLNSMLFWQTFFSIWLVDSVLPISIYFLCLIIILLWEFLSWSCLCDVLNFANIWTGICSNKNPPTEKGVYFIFNSMLKFIFNEKTCQEVKVICKQSRAGRQLYLHLLSCPQLAFSSLILSWTPISREWGQTQRDSPSTSSINNPDNHLITCTKVNVT